MTIELEVCIDNLESLHLAIEAGATRIELCSSLALGGLTPSYGFMKQAAKHSTVPVYAMIRPRQGDFLFSEQEMQIMLEDVRCAKQAGLQGIVIGVLQSNGEIDKTNCQTLIHAAQGMGVTFHRAIDQCCNAKQALEDIIDLGCERVLTSGLAANAYDGMDTISEMVKQVQGRISIMAGAGVNLDNAKTILNKTGVREIHLSGKSTRPSLMQSQTSRAKMGHDDVDDFAIPVTSKDIIQAVKAAIQ
ncbi:copper homeostasis protein CutC [Vibrio gangliei]|uniref:copper homeostasis protein CutC n=1 Tax=Vibrio gangliei TaxID=2077090 RepID=UPI000D013E67|nr:copper homeostasis protein CutC [Vibrio gangliei]